MPVISPRRSSTSNSGASLFGTSASTSLSGISSSTVGSSSYRLGSSYLDRAGSLSKTTSPTTSSSSYSKYSSPSYSYLNSSSYSTYTPRTSSQRSSSSSSSSYYTPGTSGLGTYRSTSSYLGTGSNVSSATSRYGLPKKPTTTSTTSSSGDTLKKDDSYETRKPPRSASDINNNSNQNKRLSGSCSSSSLARLVATSGLDIYEKYSPAHYKTNVELSRSRSTVNESAVANASADDLTTDTKTHNDASNSAQTITLERPRGRYSHLYADRKSVEKKSDAPDTVEHVTSRSRSGTRNAGKLVTSASTGSLSNINSNSSNDVPTANFTLRSRRSQKSRAYEDADKNGDIGEITKSSTAINANGGLDAVETLSQLKELKPTLSASSNALNIDSGNKIDTELSVKLSLNNLNSSSSSSSSSNRQYSGSNSISNHISGGDGDVSTTATLKLVDTHHLSKLNKIILSRSLRY